MTDEELFAALRASDEPAAEPDWDAMQARIREAVAREPVPGRRRRIALAGLGLAALAAIVALALWPAERGISAPRAALTDAAAPAGDLDDPLAPDELVAAFAVPNDLGGITIDDALVDEAAALNDDRVDDRLDDRLDEPAGAPAIDPLLPDSMWLDELSDEDLDRAIEWLAKEAG